MPVRRPRRRRGRARRRGAGRLPRPRPPAPALSSSDAPDPTPTTPWLHQDDERFDASSSSDADADARQRCRRRRARTPPPPSPPRLRSRRVLRKVILVARHVKIHFIVIGVFAIVKSTHSPPRSLCRLAWQRRGPAAFETNLSLAKAWRSICNLTSEGMSSMKMATSPLTRNNACVNEDQNLVRCSLGDSARCT